MKCLTILIAIIVLNSCVRSYNVSDSPHYRGQVEKFRSTKRKYIVYEDVEPGAKYRKKFIGNTKVMTSPSAIDVVKHYGDASTYYEFVPKGSRYRIDEVVRRQDPSGTWDYVIGHVYFSGKSVKFNYMLGEIGINPNLHNNMP